MPKMKVGVDPVDVFKELALNFTDPLELFREAISNSYDAGANNIWITVRNENWKGNLRYVITVRDDGAGMVFDEERPSCETGELQKFFTLGRSMRADGDRDWIGEKGIGMKIVFHSEYLEVTTWAGPHLPVYRAFVEEPWRTLHAGELPDYEYEAKSPEPEEAPPHTFTEVRVVGFFDNDGSHLLADEIEDYIKWFTKWGSFEGRIREELKKDKERLSLHLNLPRPGPAGKVTLEAPGAVAPREIPFGHPFPDMGSEKILKNQSLGKALEKLGELPADKVADELSDLKRKHWMYFVKVGQLSEFPQVTWQAVVSVEGERAKHSYNPCLRTRGAVQKFSYKAEDRYGLWFCKDYFPAAHVNEVAMRVLTKEGQRSRFKVLFNSQFFRLNADRTSVGNTDAGILRALEGAAAEVVKEMVSREDWTWSELIEEEAQSLTSESQDRKQLEGRRFEAFRKPLIRLEDGTELARAPATEAETVLLLHRLAARFEKLFGFHQPLDWRTDKGIDSVVEAPGPGQDVLFVEFKRDLRKGQFNHTFRWLDYVVCWQVTADEEDTLTDTAGKKMRLKRHKPEDYELPDQAPWTLEGGQRVVRVFSLKDILEEKLNAKIESPD